MTDNQNPTSELDQVHKKVCEVVEKMGLLVGVMMVLGG